MKSPEQNAELKAAAQDLKLRAARGDNGGAYDQAFAEFREEIATVLWNEENKQYIRAWVMPHGSIVPVVTKFGSALAAWEA